MLRKASVLNGYKVLKGRVGSMDSAKIFAAIETAAKKEYKLLLKPYEFNGK